MNKNNKLKYILILIIVLFITIFLINKSNFYSQNSLEILTKQSYPIRGEIWETKFKTNGVSKLTIQTINHTRWSKTNKTYDLLVKGLYCGNKSISINFTNNIIVINNYSCNKITSLKKEVITTGKHFILINFANQKGISQNLATITRTYNMGNRGTYGHTAYEKGNGAPTSPTNYETQATATDYTNLATSNNNYWSTSLANNDGEYDSQIYHINITENINSISQITTNWEGHSSEVRTNYDLSYFIWNLNTLSWNQISTDADGSTTDVSWSSTYNTNFNNYIDTSSGNKKIYLYSRFRHYVASFSCPFVYSYDGINYTLDHESFPFSVIKANKATSFDRLQYLKEVNGEYKIKIKEELPENSFIDNFDFFVVDHNGSGFVMPDITGNIHTIENLTKPLSCSNENNISCIEKISDFDNIYLRDNFKNVNISNKKTYRDTFNLEFEKPINTTNAKILMKIKKQIIISKAWSYYVTSIGENNWKFLEYIITNTFLKEIFQDALSQAINLKIEIKTNSGWKEVGSIKAGMDTLDDFLIYVNTSNINSNKLNLRLSSTKGFYEIDYIGIDYSPDQKMEIIKLNPTLAIFNNKTNILENITHNDKNYISLFKHDEIDLTYKAPKKTNNWTRDYSISISGYYNFINYNEQSIFGFIKGLIPWLNSMFFPDDIPKLLFENLKDKDSRKHNTIYSDYVEVKITSQEGLTWNKSSYNFTNIPDNTSQTKLFTFNSTNFNSNIQITITGNATNIININQTTFSDMIHAQTNQVKINCSPLINTTPGIYQSQINVHSNQHVVGDTLTITCTVIDNINPKVTNINPIQNTTFIEPISIPINATVTDNTLIDNVYAKITYSTFTINLNLTDPNLDNIYTSIYVLPAYYGRYNITIIANDTSNNINNTQTSYFITRLEYAPNITSIYPNSTFAQSYVPDKIINISINEPTSQLFNLTYSAESQVIIKWFIDGIENTINENSTNYLWSGNYNQEGMHTIKVNVSNLAGFDYRIWNLNIINTTEPELFVFSPQNITYLTNKILINFTSTYPNLDKLWYNNGTQNISYTTEQFVNLSQGTHTFRFYANNTLSQIQNKNVTFFIDSIAPTINIVNPLNNSIFNTTSILVNISSNGDNIWFYNSTSNQTYLSPITINFKQGINKIQAWATDLVGNLNTTYVNIFIDSIKPIINVFSPINNYYYNASTIIINFTAFDTNLDKLWYNNGTQNIPYLTEQTKTLPDGTYSYKFYANDTLSNTISEQRDFTIDTIKPLLNLYSPINNYYYNTSTIIINFTAFDTNLDKLWYNNGTQNFTYTTPQTKTLPDNLYTYTFYANDSAGNTISKQINFTIDTILPTINVSTPIHNKNYLPTQNITINFTAFDINLDKLWYNNGTQNIPYTTEQILSIPTGVYSYIFYANDSAGNTISKQINFTIQEKLIAHKNMGVTKCIKSINKNLYLININVKNYLNFTLNLTPINFISDNFMDGSFSLLPTFTNILSGPTYIGKNIFWNLTLTQNETKEINYSISGLNSKYKTLDNFIIGID